MSLDLSFEEIFFSDEIKGLLKISDDDLCNLESHGLPFVEVKGKHFYLASSMAAFFKSEEITIKVTDFKKGTQDGME
jgi:hypothetical protein